SPRIAATSKATPMTDPMTDSEAVAAAYAKAWFTVCDALDEVDPDWMMGEKSGAEAAAATIRDLAARLAATPHVRGGEVAWRYRDASQFGDTEWRYLDLPPLNRYAEVEPLYTAPPAAVPADALTELVRYCEV